jgi:sulfur-oxidizing protein SoxX
MKASNMKKFVLALFSCVPLTVSATEAYVAWQSENFAISEALTDRGNCLACHKMPIPEEPFHGTLGPDLSQVAARLSEAEMRLRVVDEKQLNPLTVMPGYYRDPGKLHLVAEEYTGKTLLTAQQVEDVVAYLMTLK